MNEQQDIEEENLYGKDSVQKIQKPYDPMKVDIDSRTMSIQSVLDRLENDEFDLNPDFQRKDNLWKEKEQSRLIESILIRVPLPAFYFDSRDDNKWSIVDGLQRISTINNFVVRKPDDELKLYLSNLEYLKEYNGLTYEDLPRPMQRRIRECQIFCYCIRPGTPDDITISIFKRINTGGTALTLPEIRNAVFHGNAANLVRDMALSNEFVVATRKKISPQRMMDRDLATRFLAFYTLGYEKYEGDMNDFLERGMEFVKTSLSELDCSSILSIFIQSMKACTNVFGEYSFRKLIKDKNIFGPLNKSLFECLSVCMSKLSAQEQKLLADNKKTVLADYKALFSTSFYDAISSATGTIEHAKERYTKLTDFFNKEIRSFS